MQAVCLEAITAKSLPAAEAALLHLHERIVQGGAPWLLRFWLLLKVLYTRASGTHCTDTA